MWAFIFVLHAVCKLLENLPMPWETSCKVEVLYRHQLHGPRTAGGRAGVFGAVGRGVDHDATGEGGPAAL